MKISPREFVDKWKNSNLRERAGSQEHFIDICRLVGHQTPAELDTKGNIFTFDKKVNKTAGEKGFVDAWYNGKFGWEYKGKHGSLEKAYLQLLQYREDLNNPPLLVVSDMEKIVIHTNFTNTEKKIFELGFEDLLTDKLEILNKLFFRPNSLSPSKKSEEVTVEAAEKFSEIAANLRKSNYDSKQIAKLLIRLLFCLFAEDINLLPEKIISGMVIRNRIQPDVFNLQIRDLFTKMAIGGFFGPYNILYFDGNLFNEEINIDLDSDCLNILQEICNLDWTKIEPSIIGTLFERSLDPSKRSQLGAHYTSKDDILQIVEPVIMDELRSDWKTQKKKIDELLEKKRDQKKSKNSEKNINNIILGFLKRLASVTILDPACGSGNFLYVALHELLDLWNEVSTFAQVIGQNLIMPTPDIAPSPKQLYGIETNIYAYQLAQVTIWIGYIQWLINNGYGFPSEPILKPINNIENIDAIIQFDGEKCNKPNWPPVDYIIGNPPFLGSKKMRPSLGDNYCDKLVSLYGDDLSGFPDYVAYWFQRAIEQLQKDEVRRVGLLATQSIRFGKNREVLGKIKELGDIFMAWQDKEWILEGAKVHVSIIAFDKAVQKEHYLNGEKVYAIHPDLTSKIDLTKAKRIEENLGFSYQGDVLRGPFILSDEDAKEMLNDIGNPNGKSNSDVIRLRMTGNDLTSCNPPHYVIDFGLDMSIEEACLYQKPFEYVKKHVYPIRKETNQKLSRDNWWIHWMPRKQMREKFELLSRYIATPRVSKYRIFVFLDKSILPDAQLVVFPREDFFFFGILQSRIHELWARIKGSQLRDAESGFRYSKTMTFETFPFPWKISEVPQKKEDLEKYSLISIKAEELSNLREEFLRKNPQLNLTELYNKYPEWLRISHDNLDKAVLSAYELNEDVTDYEILSHLLDLNLRKTQ